MNVVVGDSVQWESQGVLFFKSPRVVKEVTSFRDEKFVIVEDGPTGIPVNQIKVVQRCLNHYGDGKWICFQCNESWTSQLLYKHQIPIPCFCPHCNKKLNFKQS